MLRESKFEAALHEEAANAVNRAIYLRLRNGLFMDEIWIPRSEGRHAFSILPLLGKDGNILISDILPCYFHVAYFIGIEAHVSCRSRLDFVSRALLSRPVTTASEMRSRCRLYGLKCCTVLSW